MRIRKSSFGLWFFCFLLLITISFSCERQKAKQKSRIKKQKPVEIIKVEKTTVTDKYEYSGILRAFKEVKLSNEVSGVITLYLVDKGTRVKKGQLLVRIDDDDYKRKVEEMRARLERAVAIKKNAEKEYERKKRLYDRSVISESTLEKEFLNYQTAKADERLAQVLLEQAQDDYRKTKIYSPFDGIVLEKYREVGELVPAGTLLLQIADYSKVKLEIGVSEKDVINIDKQSKVEVLVDPFPNEIFPGIINYVGVNIESETGTFPVEIIIKNPDFKLLPGMVARSIISGKVHNGLILIPQTSLRKYFGEPVVFIEKDNRAVRRPVTLGRVFGEKIEITNGILPGEHLIVLGLSNLRDGDPVKVMNKG